MNASYGNALVIAGLALSLWIRRPYERSNAKIPVARSHQNALENLLLLGIVIGFLALPLLAIFTPALDFARYPLRPWALGLGGIFLLAYLWLFYRAHADLGANWSKTLEIRENHRLVQEGVYRHVRHPMYSSMFLYTAAQLLLLPNWVAGPAAMVTGTLLYALRVNREEAMMMERFGEEYQKYRQRTGRLIPRRS